MAKRTWRQSYTETRPVSFTTLLLWGAVWAVYGSASTTWIVLREEGYVWEYAAAVGTLFLVPLPALCWFANRSLRLDRKRPVEVPRGEA